MPLYRSLLSWRVMLIIALVRRYRWTNSRGTGRAQLHAIRTDRALMRLSRLGAILTAIIATIVSLDRP